MALEIKLDRADGVYRPGEKVTGAVVVRSESGMSHQGIKLVVDGSVALQLSARTVGLFEAFYSSLKPQHLLAFSIEVSPPGKLPPGVTELPFSFPLNDIKDHRLFDTYHGVYVSVLYLIKCEMERSMMNKNLKKTREFVVESRADGAERPPKTPLKFKISPESLQNVRRAAQHKVPDFLFEGHLDATVCRLDEPFTGEITVKRCALDIRSIELQLVRVETCTYMDGEAREATEIQNIQIGDGQVVHDVAIPIHMVFPRLFTAPSMSTKSFSVSFEVNLIVLLGNSNLITENFPIKLVR